MAGPHAESEAEVVGRHDHGDVTAGRRLSVVVVTPRGSVLSRTVDEVTAPGLLGEFGTLPGHIPFLAALKSGVLALREGTKRDLLAVGPGYLQVGAGDRVQVLVARAERPDEIDVDGAKEEVSRLESELKTADARKPEVAEKRAQLDWARARIEAAKRAGGGAGGGGKSAEH